MLWTIVGITFVLWLLGMAASFLVGGLIHLLLVVAIVAVAINMVNSGHPA